jgi:CRISPR-associated endonuclease/helicase Cas3
MRHNRIAMPDDARHLIESVYSDNAQEQIPEALLLATSLALGAAKGEQGMAALNSLRLDKGYTRNSAESSGGWDEEVRIPTRLSAESVDVALARLEGDELKPYALAEKHSWSLSQISLPQHEWQRISAQIPSCWEGPIEKLKNEVPELRWVEVLPLTHELQNCYSAKDGWNVKGIPA